MKDDTVFKKPREVMYKNTRFDVDPFCKALNKSQIQQAAALNAQVAPPTPYKLPTQFTSAHVHQLGPVSTTSIGVYAIHDISSVSKGGGRTDPACY